MPNKDDIYTKIIRNYGYNIQKVPHLMWNFFEEYHMSNIMTYYLL